MFGWLKKIWNKVKTLFWEIVRVVWHKNILFKVTMITLFIVLVSEISIAIFFVDGEMIKTDCQKTLEKPATECSQITFFKLFYVVVKYTSQATIILMIVTFVYLLIGWINLINLKQQIDRGSLDEKIAGSRNIKEDLQRIDAERKDLQTKALIEVLIGSLSASAIPTGLSLIICAFYNINLIQFMLGVEIYIAFAGISIISIAFLSTMRQDTGMKEVYSDYSIGSPEDMLIQKDDKDDKVKPN